MAGPKRLPPPPFWRTRYYALHVMGKPGRRNIDVADIRRALAAPYKRQRQPDGRIRHWFGCRREDTGCGSLPSRTARRFTMDSGTEISSHGEAPSAAPLWQPVRYCVETDTMAIEIRPWPGRDDGDAIARDAGIDLIIHYAPDGDPWLWEIEHASCHPEHIAAALAALRRQVTVAT